MKKSIYHFCTDALKDSLLCRDKEDFKAVWNYLAICALINGISVYCLCLMSNHFHILLSGTTDMVASFFYQFKQKTGIYLKNRYGNTPVKDLCYQLFPVPDRKAFCREVAYILRNPFKAGISNPFAYRWSSATAYFNPYPCEGIRKNSFPVRILRMMLKTRSRLPDAIRIFEGVIIPDSFIERNYVENMFDGSPIQFFNLVKAWNLEDLVNESHGMNVTDAYTDEEVLKGIRMMCQDTFGGVLPDRLDKKSLATLTRKVHTRFGCPRSQLLRLLPVDDFLLDRIL